MDIPATFAPVIIPTLCRFTHFRDCIESLEACTWASRTDVYVAVDYPVSESHRAGRDSILSYLENKQHCHGFKKLEVVVRQINYGQYRNMTDLFEMTFRVYDRVIFTEDDNIFSPAFLDYVNRGLDRYEKDNTVLGICGYRHFYDVDPGDSSIYRQNIDFSAWGFGLWKDRWERLSRLDHMWFRDRMSVGNMWKVKCRHGNNRLMDFVGIVRKKRVVFSDNMLSVYMALAGCDVVMPAVSMVKNNGWDGSGVNCHTSDNRLISRLEGAIICGDRQYPLSGDGKDCYDHNLRIYRRQSYGRKSTFQLVSYLLRSIAAVFLCR